MILKKTNEKKWNNDALDSLFYQEICASFIFFSCPFFVMVKILHRNVYIGETMWLHNNLIIDN